MIEFWDGGRVGLCLSFRLVVGWLGRVDLCSTFGMVV